MGKSSSVETARRFFEEVWGLVGVSGANQSTTGSACGAPK